MGLPEYLKDKSPQKRGRKREDKARKHLNSGAVWFDRFDLSFKNYLIDVKDTNKKSFKISLQKLRELYSEATNQGKIGAMLIYMGELVVKVTIQRKPLE